MPKTLNTMLLKAELQKVWNRPIFELALALVFLMAVGNSTTLYDITIQPDMQSALTGLVAESLIRNIKSQMMPLVLFSGLLVSLSFAQDYEQGLIQTLFSLPVSRATIFVVKFVAIAVPLTLLSWGATLIVMFLNFQSTVVLGTVMFQLTAYVLPITLLAIMFYAGLGAIVSLIVKRTTKAAFISILMGLFFWFISQLEEWSIGSLAQYMVFTPFKAPIVTLGRVIGVKYAEGAAENALPAWGFLGLIIFYVLVFLVPTYLYFTKKFEVEE